MICNTCHMKSHGCSKCGCRKNSQCIPCGKFIEVYLITLFNQPFLIVNYIFSRHEYQVTTFQNFKQDCQLKMKYFALKGSFFVTAVYAIFLRHKSSSNQKEQLFALSVNSEFGFKLMAVVHNI